MGSYIDTERFIFDTPEVVARHYPLTNTSDGGSFSRQLSKKIRQLHYMLTDRGWGIYKLNGQISMALGEGYDDRHERMMRYWYASDNSRFFNVVVTPRNIKRIIRRAKRGRWASNVRDLMSDPTNDEDSDSTFLFFTDFKLTADLLYEI